MKGVGTTSLPRVEEEEGGGRGGEGELLAGEMGGS